MSAALLKKSLEMFKDDLLDEGSSGKKKKTSNPMKQISTKKRGVKKELQRIKKQEEAARQLKLKKKRVRTAEDDVADMQEYDMTEDNITNIQRLSALSKTNRFVVSQILDSHRGKLSKNQPPEEKKPEEPKSILFDDS